jgi:hypothetical protein
MSDGFLARWAQRKRAVRLSERPEPPPEAEASLDGPAGPDDGAARPGEGDAEAQPDLLADLPSLADLTAETDLTPFLRAGIPAVLRNAALRKMWSVDPAIRDFVSEAREYAYDWNTPGSVPGLGPLLPSDDVKAMLGRLINAAPSEEDGGDSGEPETTGPNPDPEPESPPVSASVDAAPMPDIVTADVRPAPAPANFTNDPITTTETIVTKQRLRRHGGAMPT